MKKGPAAICREPFSECHYSRDITLVLKRQYHQGFSSSSLANSAMKVWISLNCRYTEAKRT